LSLSNFVLLSSVKPSGQDAGKAYYYANLYNPQIVVFDHSILSETEQLYRSQSLEQPGANNLPPKLFLCQGTLGEAFAQMTKNATERKCLEKDTVGRNS